MDLVDDDGLYREDGMWNTYFHLKRERDRCEIWWYFWFMFSGQTQIHLPNMAYFHIYLVYVSNLSRLQIDFRFTTIRLITTIPWISSIHFLHCHLSSIFAKQFANFFNLKLLIHLHKVVFHLSKLLSLRALEPNWVVVHVVWVYTGPVRLYSAGLPTAGPNNRFSRPSRPARSSTEFWSEEWGGQTVRN